MIFPFSHFLMLFDSLCEEEGCEPSGVLGSGLVSVSFPHAAQGFAGWPPLCGEINAKRGA